MFWRCYARPMPWDTYAPDIVAPRYALRLGDLGPTHVLYVRCDACLRVALIEASALRRSWPPYVRIIHMERRFRCLRCGPGPVTWSVYRRIETGAR
jgi:hypothetical protein